MDSQWMIPCILNPFRNESWLSWNMRSEGMHPGLAPSAFWYEAGVIHMQSAMDALCDMDSDSILTISLCSSWHSFSMHHYTGSGRNLPWLPSALQHGSWPHIDVAPVRILQFRCIQTRSMDALCKHSDMDPDAFSIIPTWAASSILVWRLRN